MYSVPSLSTAQGCPLVMRTRKLWARNRPRIGSRQAFWAKMLGSKERIRRTAVDNMMAAANRRRPRQSGDSRTSMLRPRRMSSAQSTVKTNALSGA